MSAIFISHSSSDNAFAAGLRKRLQKQGHHSVFLDFDPERGIPAGRDWEKELYAQLRGCRAVILVCSKHSMKSQWCFAEIAQARASGKPIFPLKIADCKITPLLRGTQVVDFTRDREAGYKRLWSGLKEEGLDSASVFDWDGERPPFPGLEAFDEKDAAFFFGREDKVDECIELLNRSRTISDRRLFVVRGASGSGKSSMVRAGVLPKLRRDPDKWIVLAPFRPAEIGGPFAALTRAMELALEKAGRPRKLKHIEERLRRSTGAQEGKANKPLLELALDLGPQQQSVLITVDQAEELLAPDLVDGGAFLRFVGRVANALDGPFFVVLTLRSDFLSTFEEHREIRDKPREGIHVAPLAIEDLPRVIEQPAKITGIELGPGLVQAMVSDVGDSTALPFLAFVLRQLWDRQAQESRMTFKGYQELKGLKGAIGRTADAVYGSWVKQQEKAKTSEQEEELRKAFLSLVQIGEEGQFIRQPAKLARLPQGVQDIIERFVRSRLLVKSGDKGGEALVELAHETVLTGWPRLAGWVDKASADLRLLRQVKSAAAEWHQKGGAEEFLWPDKRLDAAYDMIGRLEPELGEVERKFLGLTTNDDLLAELEDPATRHHRRAYIGDRLAKKGDTRSGIGLRADGLPDIIWCDVPGGEVRLDGLSETFKTGPFRVSKYPVTWAQYSSFLHADDGHQNPRWLKGLARHDEQPAGTRKEIDNHPATCVSWYDSVAFCRWLTFRLGYEVRLPTEWEWQLAATGGDPSRKYPWGPDWDARRANTNENGLMHTIAVGMYPFAASPVGALDMSGNAYEWCLNQGEKPQEIGIRSSKPKAARGGSCGWTANEAVVTVRGWDMPDVRIPDHGFRVTCLQSTNMDNVG
jgi:hypothetical protein